MPSEKLEKGSILMLKKFSKMDADIPQNNSHAELLHATSDNVENSVELCEKNSNQKTLRDIKAREWIVILILFFVNLINYMDRFTIAGILTDIQKHFKIQDDKGGLLQTAFVICYMIFAPIFGYMGDRYSRRLIMTAGVFLWSVTTLVGSFMDEYWWFLFFRALVGIGEASYSTIAPTIISDLFVGDNRSKMLALFYFAIPVGSGMGYIVGSETAKLMDSWQWALRVTPALGIVAVLLLYFVLEDPERGESEGSGHLQPTSWLEDVKDLVQNKSFMFSTAGFTCVAFVAGALSWWGPKFIQMGINLQSNSKEADADSVAFKFGVVAMLSGLLGVPIGSLTAQRLRHHFKRIDAHICGIGLLVSAPLVFFSFIAAGHNETLCYVLVFFAEFFLNLTWSIVGDILLYVVVPTRRSTAEGFQLLVSHSLGDAGSPSLIGVLSDAFRFSLNSSLAASALSANSSNVTIRASSTSDPSDYNSFKALQYALFTTCFVEVLGGLFFLVTALYIVEDKRKVDKTLQANSQQLLANPVEEAILIC